MGSWARDTCARTHAVPPDRGARVSSVMFSEWTHWNAKGPFAGAAALVAVLVLGACGGSKGTGSTATTASRSTTTTGQASTAAKSTSPGSGEIAPGVVSGSSGALAATMHAAGHHPHVGKPWPISFLATEAGKPAHVEVAYEYLFGGQVVAHRSHYEFTGRFHDVFRWPSSAVGFPLTFRAVIKGPDATLNLDYAVQVIS
jgi:hypothetical protein